MALKWGILTAGNISRAFAAGVRASRTGTLVATGARDLRRAQEFAHEFGGRGVEGYEAVLLDPEVQAVYIATPHHLHAKCTVEAARAGKAILCEKPFTLHAAEAEEAIREVRQAGVFFMEAFMYRCSPQMRKLVQLLGEKAIGDVRAIDAEFGFASAPGREGFRFVRELGGGGIMDVGTYCVSFARLVAGEEPATVHYTANLDRGYDSYGVGTLTFQNGIVAKIASGVHLQMRNDARVYGEGGHIHIEDPWKCAQGSKMTLYRYGKEPEPFALGCSTDELYGSEADAVAEHLTSGECPFMSVEDTLANMRCLDRVREACGLSFV